MSAQPPEPTDAELLARLDRVHDLVDPPPPDLDERVLFGLSGAWLEAEIAQLLDAEVVGARGPEQAQTLTFETEAATLVVRVHAEAAGTHRIDGWLAPARPAVAVVRLHRGREREAAVDADGRFALSGVLSGLVQIVIRDDEGRSVLVTPAFDI